MVNDEKDQVTFAAEIKERHPHQRSSTKIEWLPGLNIQSGLQELAAPGRSTLLPEADFHMTVHDLRGLSAGGHKRGSQARMPIHEQLQ